MSKLLSFLFILLAQSTFASTLESPTWIEHQRRNSTREIEPGCHPRKYTANGLKKGVVIMLHGHSSCPQQFTSIAPLLAQKGFDVYTPLLPGPGPLRLPNGDDDLRLLPDNRSWQKYMDFSSEVVQIADELNAPLKVLAGVSLGGALTLHITSRYPQIFNRQLIVTPLFKFLSPGGDLADTLAEIPLIRDNETGWGEPCLRERRLGRAGLCQFKIRHAAGAQKMGNFAYENAIFSENIQTQFVAVEKDPYVSNAPIEKLMQQSIFQKENNSNSSGCYFREGTNHSPFSRFDTPWEIKFWFESFDEMVINFVTMGQFFIKEGPSPESQFGRCRTFK